MATEKIDKFNNLHRQESRHSHHNGEPWQASSGNGRRVFHLKQERMRNSNIFANWIYILVYFRTRSFNSLNAVRASVVRTTTTVSKSLSHCWMIEMCWKLNWISNKVGNIRKKKYIYEYTF
jgi:hypothetical protein